MGAPFSLRYVKYLDLTISKIGPPSDCFGQNYKALKF